MGKCVFIGPSHKKHKVFCNFLPNRIKRYTADIITLKTAFYAEKRNFRAVRVLDGDKL
jgi:hypothetical protein